MRVGNEETSDLAKSVELTTASSGLHPVWRVVAWCPVTLFGLPTEGSCVLKWACALVLRRK
jgi:hypothetical protein